MRRAALLALAVLLATPALGHAAAPAKPKAKDEGVQSPKRRVPDYGGQGHAEGARALLVVPKVVLLPPYLIWNYGIRKPLGVLVSTAERKQWPTKVLDFFTFGPDRNAGVVPTALFDFGIKPSVGVFAFWNRVLHDNNSANVHFGFWGPKWLNLTAADRLRVGTESYLTLAGRFTRRPDMPFYGIGPRSLLIERVRYTSNVKEIGIGADMTPTATTASAKANEGGDAPPARFLRVLTRVGVRSGDFSEGYYDNDPNDFPDGNPRDLHNTGLVNAVNQGRLPMPPGFTRGYVAPFQRLEVQIDTRARRPANQSGARLALEAEHGSDVRNANGAAWVRWGGTAGVFVDTGKNRTLGVTFTAMFADPLRGEVPFTELVTFGGSTYMRGFLWNRLIGRSGGVATLQYNWPIWLFLDGTIQASLGNVFDAHFKDFSPKLLRFSGAIGVRTSNTPNQAFEAMFGVGTETFADRFLVNSFRLVIGTNQF